MNRVTGKVYFEEKFDDGSKWLDRWVVSDWKKSDGTAGEWKLTAGDFYGDAEEGIGIQTGQDARFYAISSKFNEAFSNEDKDLVVQFQVKHPQKIDCGGGYIKLLPYDVDQKKFSGDSKYYIMFGMYCTDVWMLGNHIINT
jgi:calreticulin